MRKMRIAIHKNEEIFNHSTTWDIPWIEYCENNNIDFSVIDCFKCDVINTLRDYDCLLWHFNNYTLQDMLFARSILNSAKKMGLKVFPDYDTSWHFDDKVAETYLLQSVGAPTPQSWMFYTYNSCKDWVDNCKTPIIAKLRCGSGASNVKLLNSKRSILKYSKRMFSSGYKTSPSLLYKTRSNVNSARDWETIIKRFKRIPDFLKTLSNAKKFPKEKGYTFFQEFIPNDGYDLKIVVIGDKLSFIARNVRKGDFRASGGGDLFFDKSLVTNDIIQSAFDVSNKLNFQCMGYDYVVDKRTITGKIVEISYGFSHTALLMAGGYWDRKGVWHNEPLNAPYEVLKNLINTQPSKINIKS
jgi:glutathione synthase/RimK-type ligase-like ATP-grasp enzyme